MSALLKSPFVSQIVPGQILVTGLMHVAVVVLSWLAITASAGWSKFHLLKQSQESSIASRQSVNDKEVPRIEAGKPLERELAGGDTHKYAVLLSAGTFLHAIVDQRGIDVVVAVVAVDGKKVAEIDSPNGKLGPEHVYWIAETSGLYQLEVRSWNKDAATGRYEVNIIETRLATHEDASRVAAQKAFAEGMQLQGLRTADSVKRAVNKYEEALNLWTATNDMVGQANTLNKLGGAYFSAGEPKKALEVQLHALQLMRALENRIGEATARFNIGTVLDYLGEKHEALVYYDQALSIHRAVGDRWGEAVTLTNIAVAYDSLGEKQKALGYFNTALPLLEAYTDRRAVAIALNNIGTTYDSLGEHQKALDYFNQSLSLRRAVNDRPGEANTLNNMGLVFDSLGERQKALDYFNSALQLHRASGNRGAEGTTLGNIGFVYNSLGEKQKALDYHNQALLMQRAVSDRLGEAATLNNIGSVYISLGENQRALDYFQQSLPISKDIGYRIVQARNLFGIAQAERNRGDLVEARKNIEAALDVTESIRTQVGSLDLRASYFATVQQYYDLYINLLMRFDQLHPKEGYSTAALQASERSRARSLLETLVEARVDLRQGINPDLLERERSLLQRLNAKNERLVRLLSRAHTEQQAQEANTEIAKLATEFQQVQAEIRSKSPRYAALMQPQPLSLNEIQQQIVDADTLLLEYALGEERSFVWAVSPNTLLSFELPKRSVIKEAAQRLYDLLTARARQVEGETLVHKRARIARADAAYPAAATALSNMLLGPVASHLGTKRLLIVSDGALQYIPFAALPRPFPGHASGRVNRSNQPLVLEHEIINLPSASTLAVLRNELAGRRSAPKIAAVFADPVFEPTDLRLKRGTNAERISASDAATSDTEPSLQRLQMTRSLDDADMIKEGRLAIPRLPYSQSEAEVIRKLVPEKSRRLAVGLAVNHAAVTDPELENYAIVHFATHSLLNSKQPELSGVLLSLVDEHGQPQERGILSLGEIYNLKLHAEMVVLSACRTALGKEVKGEGLIGLTRGFMYAGAARVVASLWKADDEATAELMTLFYQRMLGKQHLRPAAALRHAQIDMWRSRSSWSAPYYWAGFTLQGEWK